jgi:hypothetical protein
LALNVTFAWSRRWCRSGTDQAIEEELTNTDLRLHRAAHDLQAVSDLDPHTGDSTD